MLRVDRSVTPTMAKTPTLAQWELDHLRTIDHVVRLGHLRRVEPTRLVLDEGEVAIAPDAVVVHCAAAGFQVKPMLPIWGREAITLQPIRSGFPCFGAGLAGYVEAIIEDDEEKNGWCPPSPYSNSITEWCRMQVLGGRASMSFGANPDIKAWADGVALNPPAPLRSWRATRSSLLPSSASGERGRGHGPDGRARRHGVAGQARAARLACSLRCFARTGSTTTRRTTARAGRSARRSGRCAG